MQFICFDVSGKKEKEGEVEGNKTNPEQQIQILKMVLYRD